MLKFRNALLAVLSIFVLSACGNASTSSADTTSESSETASVESNASKETTKTETPAKGNRTNPYKVGETARLEFEFQGNDGNSYPAVLDLTLSNPLRGEEAYNYLISVTEVNEPAPEGYEWFVVDVTGTLVEGDENVPLEQSARLSSVSASGAEAPEAPYFLESDYGDSDLYEGGTTTGPIVTLVPAAEPFTLQLTLQSSERVFFTLE